MAFCRPPSVDFQLNDVNRQTYGVYYTPRFSLIDVAWDLCTIYALSLARSDFLPKYRLTCTRAPPFKFCCGWKSRPLGLWACRDSSSWTVRKRERRVYRHGDRRRMQIWVTYHYS